MVGDPSRRVVFTEAMYLAMERVADTKHELRDGELVAMAGGSPRHNRLTSTCIGELHAALRGRDCVPLGSDQRVRVPARGSYCYPDVTVLCGDPVYDEADADSIINPRLIVEVLSRSTKSDDLGTKFDDYTSIDSFEEYVVIWQDRVRVEVRRREGPESWSIRAHGTGDTLELRSIGVTLSVDTLYEGAFDLRGDDS